MVSTIFITRHGYRSNWLKDVPVPDPPTGIDGDPVLAPHGEEQAEQLGAFVAALEPRVQRIYSSPFYRCLQSIQPTAKTLSLDILPETGVGEWYQRDRETKPKPASNSVLRSFFPEVKDGYERLFPVSDQGETIEELHERTIGAVKAIVDSLKNEPEVQTILICTHAATRIALGRALTGDSQLEIRTGTCSMDKYAVKPDTEGLPGQWDVVFTGESSYLEKGEEMHWSFDMTYAPGSTEDIRSREAAQSKEKDEVSVYIPVDTELAMSTFSSASSLAMQIIGFDTDKPIFKMGDAAFQGEWEDMLGTEVYTDIDGNPFYMGRERIKAHPINLVDKNAPEGAKSEHKTEFQLKLEEINLQRQAGNKDEDGDVEME